MKLSPNQRRAVRLITAVLCNLSAFLPLVVAATHAEAATVVAHASIAHVSVPAVHVSAPAVHASVPVHAAVAEPVAHAAPAVASAPARASSSGTFTGHWPFFWNPPAAAAQPDCDQKPQRPDCAKVKP